MLATRIFLESTSVAWSGGVYGHLYLVLRQVEVDENGVMLENAYRPLTDLVIRGSSGFTLSVQTGQLDASDDRYGQIPVGTEGTETRPETPADRHSLDITPLLAAEQASVQTVWEALELAAQGISGQYDYEFPGADHVANSNAVVFSILNQRGVDLRDIGSGYVDSFYAGGHPGGDSDTATLLATSSNATIQASSNLNDGVSLQGRNTIDDVLIGTQFADSFHGEQVGNYAQSNDTVSYALSTAAIAIAPQPGSGPLVGTAGDADGDEFYGIENFVGTDFDDSMQMRTTQGTAFGRLENHLDGRGGADVLRGELGNDTLSGGEGNDLLDGGAESDTLEGGAGNDLVFGGNGFDTLDYTSLSGGLSGVSIARSIIVTPGGNIPSLRITAPGQGTDNVGEVEQIRLTNFSDRVDLSNYGPPPQGQSGGTVVLDGAGNNSALGDVVNFSNSSSGVTITAAPTATEAVLDTGNNSDIRLTNFETFIGTQHNDTIQLGAGSQWLYGGAGNDQLSGGAGNDTLEGGGGFDVLTGGADADWFIAGSGGAAILDADANDRLFIRLSTVNGSAVGITDQVDLLVPISGGFFMHAPWDQAHGSSFSAYNLAVFWPVTDGGAYPQLAPINVNLTQNYAVVYDMQGADLGVYIYTGSAYQAFYEFLASSYGPGPDVGIEDIRVNNEPPVTPTALVVISNYQSGDLGLTFQEITNPFQTDGVDQWFYQNIPAYTSGHQALLNNGQFGQFPTVAAATGTNPPQDGTDGPDQMNGGDGHDNIRGRGGNDNINGGAGNDTMSGGAGADALDGGAGVDTLSFADAAAGGLYLHMGWIETNEGEAAGDTYTSIENVVGSSFDDVLIITDEANVIDGLAGNDAVNGLEGDDTIRGGDGSDSLFGDPGSDNLYGDQGDDVLFGYEDHDTLIMGGGDDFGIGGSGNDVVDGAEGADELHGHEGNDTLDGGVGDDLLFGDEDGDRIILGGGNDFALGGSGNDTFVFATGPGGDLIGDFDAGPAGDVIELRGFQIADFAALQAYMSEWGGTTFIEFDANNYITLEGVLMSELSPDNFVLV
jgi:Ca2+-binding RTX toxin-like protein